jgi:hypothetical protein
LVNVRVFPVRFQVYVPTVGQAFGPVSFVKRSLAPPPLWPRIASFPLSVIVYVAVFVKVSAQVPLSSGGVAIFVVYVPAGGAEASASEGRISAAARSRVGSFLSLMHEG